MPPAAAATGRAAFLGSESPPTSISRLISRPTVKKNSVIRASFTQWGKRVGEGGATDGDGELLVPEVSISLRADIGPDKRGNGSNDEAGSRRLRWY